MPMIMHDSRQIQTNQLPFLGSIVADASELVSVATPFEQRAISGFLECRLHIKPISAGYCSPDDPEHLGSRAHPQIIFLL